MDDATLFATFARALAPPLDAPSLDAPSLDVSPLDAPPLDAPPLDARAPSSASAVRAAFDDLVRRYAEPHRRYHTLAHVEACLAWLAAITPRPPREAELVLAIFFHDAVLAYGPDDVEQSAQLAESTLASLGVPAPVVAHVAALVRATATHDAATGSDAALLVDVDLAILAAPPDVYRRYAEGIRAELAAVPEALYREGRAAFLRGLLARLALYRTRSFEPLEPFARRNLAAELASLTA